MSDGELTTYAELAAVLDSLPLLMREKRRKDRLSVRAAAEQAGVSFMTFSRWERGDTGRNVSAVAEMLRWLDAERTAQQAQERAG
jgi:transcriptional regulator with XRE-family HTH domain